MEHRWDAQLKMTWVEFLLWNVISKKKYTRILCVYYFSPYLLIVLYGIKSHEYYCIVGFGGARRKRKKWFSCKIIQLTSPFRPLPSKSSSLSMYISLLFSLFCCNFCAVGSDKLNFDLCKNSTNYLQTLARKKRKNNKNIGGG